MGSGTRNLRGTYDVLVVGAGILGCSTAWHLAARGLRVVVVDREKASGLGSTSRSTAIVRQRYTLPAGMALALEGLRTWERWDDLVPADSDGRRARLVRAGVLFVLPSGAPGTAELAATMTSLDIRAELLDAAALARRFPAMRFGPDEPVTGLYEPEGGYVDDPVRATEDAARAAGAAGAAFHLGDGVAEVLTGWRDGALEARGVRTKRGVTLQAKAVVNCAGPHSARLNLLARTPLALTTAPLRQVVVDATAPASETLASLPVVADLMNGFYLRPDPARLRIGAVWPQDETEYLADPDDADPGVERAIIDARIEAARRRVPGLEVRGPRGLVGVYDVTAQDWYPVVDRTETRGYFVAIGTSGAWFKSGPVIGRLAAEVVNAALEGRDTDEQPLEVELPLTRHRFPLAAFSRRRRPIALGYGGGVLG